MLNIVDNCRPLALLSFSFPKAPGHCAWREPWSQRRIQEKAMDFLLRRVWPGRGRQAQAAPEPPGMELSDSTRDAWSADSTLLAALDIDAAINAHERWKTHLLDYLEGRTRRGLDPAEVRRGERSTLGRWLHGVGRDLLGHQPAYGALLARHQFFHEQAAQLVEWAQLGEWNKAVQVLNGGYRYGSSQVVLLLKELKRGLPAA